MNRSEFLRLLDELVEAEPGTLKGEETLKELEGWSSLTVLGFLALVDEQFEATLSPKAVAECKTINDLTGLLGERIEQGG